MKPYKTNRGMGEAVNRRLHRFSGSPFLWCILVLFSSLMVLLLFKSAFSCQLYIELKKDKSEGWRLLQQKDNQKALLAFEMEIGKTSKNGYAKLGQVIALQNLGQLKQSHEKLITLSESVEAKVNLKLKADIAKVFDRQTALEQSKLKKNAADDFTHTLTLLPAQSPVFTPELTNIARGKKKIEPPMRATIQNLITAYDPAFAELTKAAAKEYSYFSYCMVCGDEPPNFAQYQILVKLWMLKGQLLAADGKMNDATALFRDIVRMGQQFEQNWLINYLVGYSIRQFGMEGFNTLLTYRLNESELQNMLATLDELEKKDKSASIEELRNSDFGSDDFEKYDSAFIRARIPRSQLAVAKVAVAAKLYQKKENKLPTRIADLVPTYLHKVPKDIFGTDVLHGIKNQDGFVVYSVGPNQQDENGKQLYDPTNGTLSSGDLFLRVL